jgi:hypothetical protein
MIVAIRTATIAVLPAASQGISADRVVAATVRLGVCGTASTPVDGWADPSSLGAEACGLTAVPGVLSRPGPTTVEPPG